MDKSGKNPEKIRGNSWKIECNSHEEINNPRINARSPGPQVPKNPGGSLGTCKPPKSYPFLRQSLRKALLA